MGGILVLRDVLLWEMYSWYTDHYANNMPSILSLTYFCLILNVKSFVTLCF